MSPLPDPRLLFIVSVLTVTGVVAFASGVVILVVRRNFRRRVEEQKLAAMGTATARILHQIKNPLQTIMLHADLLQDEDVVDSREARGEVCGAIIGEAERLAAMLTELSVYAAGAQRNFRMEPIPVHDLLLELARNGSRDPRIEVDTREVSPAVVMADEYYLRQALENLVANAGEALLEQGGGRLILSLETVGTDMVLGVEDTGPGIPSDRLEAVFEPFVTGKPKGMGLGLAITREIVEAHGGRITVESRRGVGTRFEVRLPLARAAEGAGVGSPGDAERIG